MPLAAPRRPVVVAAADEARWAARGSAVPAPEPGGEGEAEHEAGRAAARTAQAAATALAAQDESAALRGLALKRVDLLAARVDSLEASLGRALQSLSDASDSDRVEGEIRLLAVQRRVEELEARASEAEDVAAATAQADTAAVRRDLRASFERMREGTNVVLARLSAHVEDSLARLSAHVDDSLSRLAAQVEAGAVAARAQAEAGAASAQAKAEALAEERFLSTHARLLVLEEEQREASAGLQRLQGLQAAAAAGPAAKLHHTQLMVAETQNEVRRLTAQLQQGLAIFQRTMQQPQPVQQLSSAPPQPPPTTPTRRFA
jgi:hypothetical protein